MKTQKRYRKAALSFAISWISVAAFAAENTARLEEIIVSAQKRDETVQDVPASITALSSEALKTAGIQNITDLQSRVPSMSVGQLYGSNLITLRGISTGLTSGFEDPSVAVHLNGVYQSRSRSLDVATMDLERVEVLAGPQGTLYGRNATGGVVNYVTKAPSHELEGSLTVGVGNYDSQVVKGTISAPITDELRFRFSGLYDDQDEGFTKNLYEANPKHTFEGKKTVGGRFALAYTPTDTLQFDLDLMYVDSKTSAIFAALEAPIDSASVANLFPYSTKPHEIYSNVNNKLNSILQESALTVTWDITSATQLKSITSYQTYKDVMDIDNDAIQIEAVGVYQDDKSETFTQEFNLSTQFFDDRLTSVFGVFYFQDKMDILSNVDFFTDPFFAVFGPGFPLSPIYFDNHQKAKSYSGFTDQTYELTDKVRLLGGLRFNRDEKKVQANAFCPQGTTCPLISDDAAWNAWTSKLGVQYDVADDVMLYAQYQRGFKSGGFAANSGGQGYDPEKIDGPEIGVKSMLFDQRVRLNAAAWYYSYTNLQVQQVRGIGQFKVANAAEATLTGAEVSMEVSVTSNFKIDLAAMAQKAKYDKFENCNPSAFVGACANPTNLQPIVDSKNNWLNRAPPYTANLGLQYTFDLPNGAELLLRGESYWSGFVYYDEFNTSKGAKQDAYSVQNAFVSYTAAGGDYTIRAFAKNIGDEGYLAGSFYNSATSQFTGSWAAPRTYGAEVTLKF